MYRLQYSTKTETIERPVVVGFFVVVFLVCLFVCSFVVFSPFFFFPFFFFLSLSLLNALVMQSPILTFDYINSVDNESLEIERF